MGKRYVLIMAAFGIRVARCSADGARPGGWSRRGQRRWPRPGNQRTCGRFSAVHTNTGVGGRARPRKSLYDANCASCHAPDLRGVLAKRGPNLLQSTETFSDKQGELDGRKSGQTQPARQSPAD